MIIISLIIFKTFDFSSVDVTRTDHLGRSMFRCLMDKWLTNKLIAKNFHPFRRRLEKIFFLLISVAEKKIGSEKIDRIIESPDDGGVTVFMAVSDFSEKISSWILDRNIDVAFVNTKWNTPHFHFHSVVEKMLIKDVNPFVVGLDEKSAYSYFASSFRNINRNKKKREKLLKPFLIGKIADEKTEVYFSFDASKCDRKCDKACRDQMRKFRLYTGKRNFNQEKKGGEGIVSFGTWHKKSVAFKLLKLDKIESTGMLTEAISNAEKTREEFVTASNLSHQNIVKVLHLFRYQESRKVKDIQLCQNWTVIVMEKHDKNIKELLSEERKYLPDMLQDVLGLV